MKTITLLTMLMLAGTAPGLAPVVAPPAAGRQVDSATKTPAVVFIMRHAEKPDGDTKDPNLTQVGFQRARLIPTLFLTTPAKGSQPAVPARFPPPDAIFATDTAKHSNRPIETITPLAEMMHIKLNHDFADIETHALAQKILGGQYAGKVVVICWHHGEIPHLAEAFGVSGAPKKWDPDRYDHLWEIRWIDGVAQLTILPERLLPGDAKQ